MTCVVVVPCGYGEHPDAEIAIAGLRHLREYHTVAVVPSLIGGTERQVKAQWWKVGPAIKMPDHYFHSAQAYNTLCLSRGFYRRFERYDWMLIYQLDAVALQPNLHEFFSDDFDYIGAPWLDHDQDGPCFTVGNGGLSLRRVSAFIEACEEEWVEPSEFSTFEDSHWAAHPDIRKASVDEAWRFSWEAAPDVGMEKVGGLPFGCHRHHWNADFWKPILEAQA